MRRLLLFLIACMAASIASAQSLSDYMKLRKQYGVREAAAPEALDNFVGSRVVEIRGTVKGSFKMLDKSTILLERDDLSTIDVEAAKLPEWLTGGEVHARMLVKATRSAANGDLKVSLIAAAPEQELTAYLWRNQPRAARYAKSPSRKATFKAPTKQPTKWSLPASEVTPIYANFIRKQNPRLSAKEATLIAKGVIGFSLKYGVDARLIMAMVMVESGFDPNSTSRTGAAGLGQLMPDTARWMGVSDSYDTVDNLYGTVKLIRTHLDKYRAQTGSGFESLVLALAAYNAGEGAVKKHGGVPPYRETQAYVQRVVRLYAQFAGYRG